MQILDKAFVADAVITQKYFLFKEEYLTCEDCDRIANLIKEFAATKGYEINFSKEISDKTFFNFFPGLIKKKNKYSQTTMSLKIEDSSIRKIIYDNNKLINQCLYDIYCEHISALIGHSCRTCSKQNICEHYREKGFCCNHWQKHITIE